MKKLAALSLALLLAFSLTAASAQTLTYTAKGYFTIDYPDTLTLDDTSYTDENSDDYTWLFTLTADNYLIDASLEPAEDYEGFSLYNASEADRQTYVDNTLEDYADDNAKLVDTLTVDGNIPFYIFSIEDNDGVYYYAETLANGTSVKFTCYYSDAETALDDALLKNFEAVLTTFRRPEAGANTAATAAPDVSAQAVDATSAATVKK